MENETDILDALRELAAQKARSNNQGSPVQSPATQAEKASRAASPVNTGSSLPVAARTPQAFVASQRVDTDNVDPILMDRINALAAANPSNSGTITSGYRSIQDQANLYANRGNNPYPVAYPGTSQHNFGNAVDFVNKAPGAPSLDDSQLRKFGLHRPHANDPVHIEMLPGTENNPNFGLDGSTVPQTGPFNVAKVGPYQNMPVAQVIYNVGINRGYTPVQAQAVVANAMAESRLDSGALNKYDGRDGSNSIGFFQHNADRARGLLAVAKNMGRDPTDPEVQATHLFNELDASESSAGKRLRAAQTPDQAVSAVVSSLRPAGYTPGNPYGVPSYGQRLAYANALAKNPNALDVHGHVASYFGEGHGSAKSLSGATFFGGNVKTNNGATPRSFPAGYGNNGATPNFGNVNAVDLSNPNYLAAGRIGGIAGITDNLVAQLLANSAASQTPLTAATQIAPVRTQIND